MGRRGAVASVGSDSSAKSSFRELDDAFLQTQTRIWLGEVLNIRLGEDVPVSDLLANGELLFEVSKVVWDMLLAKCAELWHLKANLKGPVISRKISGRYRPYSNVDSFLKMCKILGLNGIDLFSPSDVVERKNTRKVCICIRALSKKVRSKQLQVPDFDIVTYTVVMPTDKVGCIRRSLESSQSSFSSSPSYSSHRQPTPKYRQKKMMSRGDGNYDSCSENSDEAESNYMEMDAHCSTNLGNAAAILPGSISPVAYSANEEKKCTAVDCASHYDNENQCFSEFENGQFESENISRPVELAFEHTMKDYLVDSMSLGHIKAPCLNGDMQDRQSAANFVRPHQNDDNLVTGVTLGDAAERDYISEYLAFSDSVVLGVDGSSPVLPDGEVNSYNFFMGIDPHGSEFKDRNHRRDSDVEDEVSSTASMSSILGRVLAMEFDDRFDLDASSATKDRPKELLENEIEENQDKGSIISFQTRFMDEHEIPSHGLAGDVKGCHILAEESVRNEDSDRIRIDSGMFRSDSDREQFTHAQILTGNCSNCSDTRPEDSNSSHECVPLEEIHPCLSTKILDGASASKEKSFNHAEHAKEDAKSDQGSNMLESVSDLREDTSEHSHDKPHQKLLKTVAKGTAVLGVLLLLLHVRRRAGGKNGEEGRRRAGDKNGEESKKSAQKQGIRRPEILSKKGQKGGRQNGIYPAEKLKIG